MPSKPQRKGYPSTANAATVAAFVSRNAPRRRWELLGREWTVEELADEVAKDRAYFEKSGGRRDDFRRRSHVTSWVRRGFSGGNEASRNRYGDRYLRTMSLGVSGKSLVLCRSRIVRHEGNRSEKARNVHRGIRTKPSLPTWIALSRLFVPIIRPPKLWVRTPLIPDATATEENLTGIGRYLAQHVGKWLERWELCAFNNLCIDKYKRLGKTWEFESTPLLSGEELETPGKNRETKRRGALPSFRRRARPAWKNLIKTRKHPRYVSSKAVMPVDGKRSHPMRTRTEFFENEMKQFEPSAKVGLVAYGRSQGIAASFVVDLDSSERSEGDDYRGVQQRAE